MTPEIRKLKLYYGGKIEFLRKKNVELESEIVRLNNVIQDKEYGLPTDQDK
jgi:hypothetical protein